MCSKLSKDLQGVHALILGTCAVILCKWRNYPELSGWNLNTMMNALGRGNAEDLTQKKRQCDHGGKYRNDVPQIKDANSHFSCKS